MKKTLLKTMLIAATLLFSINANAQSFAEGKYYLKNVASGLWWGAGNAWSTQASLVVHPEYVTLHPQDNGTYQMESQYSNGGTSYYFNGSYMDNGSPVNLTISRAGSYYTIANGETYYGYDGASTVLGSGVSPSSEECLWQIFNEEQMMATLNNASEANPVDATFVILDPNFSRNNRNKSAWTGSDFSVGGADTNNNAEKWGGNSQTFDISQTVTVPNGKYKISWNGFYRYNNTTDNTNDVAIAAHADGTEVINSFVYINGIDYPLTSIADETASEALGGDIPFSQAAASAAFGQGLYAQSDDAVIVTSGKLTIGIKKINHPGCDWTVWDNFELTYYGPITDLTPLVDAYNTALSTASELAEEPMQASVKNALTQAISDYSNINTSSKSELEDAIDALNQAISKARTSISLYKQILETYLLMVDADPYLSLDDIVTAYEAGTLNSVEDVYRMYQALEIASLGTDEGTEYTGVIINPGFEWGNTNGWTVGNSNDTGARDTNNSVYAMENSEGAWLFNTWQAGLPITQTITGLPTGKYELSVVAARDAGTVFLLANDLHEPIVVEAKEVGVEGSVIAIVNDGNLTIGAVGGQGNNYVAAGGDWYKVDNFRLVCLGNFISDEEAEALLASVPTGKMNKDVEDVLAAAKATFEASKTPANYEALQIAINNANTSIAAYANAAEFLPINKAELEGTNLYTAAVYKENITDVEEGYEDGTLTDEKAASLTDIRTGWRANNYIDDILMSAWDANVMDWNTYHVNTWSNEGDNDGSNFQVPFIEYWTGDGNSLGEKVLTATLDGFSKGSSCDVTALVRVRVKNGSEDLPYGITMQVNDGEEVDVTAGEQIGEGQMYMGEFAANGTIDSEGKFIFKFNVAADNNISWLAFKNVYFNAVAGTSTGINEVSVKGNANAIYNLSGQRIAAPVKGINIVNGKKYVVK